MLRPDNPGLFDANQAGPNAPRLTPSCSPNQKAAMADELAASSCMPKVCFIHGSGSKTRKGTSKGPLGTLDKADGPPLTHD